MLVHNSAQVAIAVAALLVAASFNTSSAQTLAPSPTAIATANAAETESTVHLVTEPVTVDVGNGMFLSFRPGRAKSSDDYGRPFHCPSSGGCPGPYLDVEGAKASVTDAGLGGDIIIDRSGRLAGWIHNPAEVSANIRVIMSRDT
jgi:hypothetical protein